MICQAGSRRGQEGRGLFRCRWGGTACCVQGPGPRSCCGTAAAAAAAAVAVGDVAPAAQSARLLSPGTLGSRPPPGRPPRSRRPRT